MPKRYDSSELIPKDIFRAVAPAVYLVIAGRSVEAIKGGQALLGSAVAVSEYWALTNCHVVKNQQLINLIDDQSDAVARAVIVRADEASDRCFLRSDEKLTPIASIRQIEGLVVGERVYTIGNPSGLTKTLGEGLISGLRHRNGIAYVQTTAPISAGSSGGALVDSHGSLIGITTFLLKDSQNLNFAISAGEYWR